jgi:hypothetical protein
MISKIQGRLLKTPLFLLPSLHLLLCLLATMLSGSYDGWGWSRMMGVDPFCAPVLMVIESLPKLFAIFAGFGTAFWAFLGFVGWRSYSRTIGRTGSLLGAILIGFFLVVGIWMTIDLIHQEHQMGVLIGAGIFQFLLIGIFFAVVSVSFLSCVAAVFGKGERQTAS